MSWKKKSREAVDKVIEKNRIIKIIRKIQKPREERLEKKLEKKLKRMRDRGEI